MNTPEMFDAQAVGAALGVQGNTYGDDSHKCTPGLLTVKTENIPDELKVQRWAVWRGTPRDDGKLGKPPCNPTTGRMIGADQPGLWGTYDQAVCAYESGGWDGIGVLMEADAGVVGIDLDDIQAIAPKDSDLRRLMRRAKDAGIYIEKSPSGKGVRAFVRGVLPNHKGRRRGGIELYSDARFLTITGHGSGKIVDAQWLVDELLAMIGTGPTDQRVATVTQGEADTAMVNQLVAAVSEQESRLWDGHWQAGATALGAVGYPSQSEADMALCGRLSREAVKLGITDAGVLQATVMAAFEQSALYRPEKHHQVEQYAIPKAAASALESIRPVAGDTKGIALATHEPGDILAGKMYAALMRGRLRFVEQAGKWLRWAGTRWEWCSRGEEMAAAKEVAGMVLNQVAKLYAQDPERHRKRMAFAMRLQTLPRLEAMIKLAKSERDMCIGNVAELDSDPWLLGVRNGAVNLKDGTLLLADPAMLITRQVQAEFHREAQCPRWLEFLHQVFDGDAETVAFIQRALGYTLTGVTTEEVLFICYGGGANGKSVFANVISEILADYGQMAPPSLLTVRREGDAGPRNDVARLCGARLVQINELNQGDRLDEQVVKMLAGRETLSARFLHREYFDFKPSAKPWLRTNHRPVITGEDDGIWRRIMLLPFKVKFPDDKRDPWLEQRLLDECDGILAWMVQGCLDWKHGGLKPSALVRRESASYRKESDLMGEFLDDKTDSDPNGRIEQSEAYLKWCTWATLNGVRHGAKKSFTRKLDERGHIEVKSNGKRYYSGLTWKA